MSNIEDIVKIALLGARDCLGCKNYGRAFANLLLFLKLKPDRAEEVYSDFSLATREWFEQLERQDRIEDLFKCYDQACELFPGHDAVLSFIGAQLFRLGYVEKAAMYIQKSLALNPDDLLARNNLENVCSHLVERWHFSMLNDKRRNMAFKCAIDKAVKSGYNTVLDIGTGTGILSMMAEMSGAIQVTACDGSRSMIDIAENVFNANGVLNRIKLLHKHSTEMLIPHHIRSRVKLLVTETFDAGLFGEHIVTTMIHAWKNLISNSPMGSVIPCGATMYVCGIECETIRQNSRLMYPVLQYLDVSQIELLCNTGHTAENPYTTENLAKIRGGYKILTNIPELMRVNFCNLWELESLNAGKDWLCELYVKQSGRLDAFTVWFDLHLDDTVTIETGPLNESCWEQVIYPITSVSKQSFYGHENYHVKKRDKLRPTFHFGSDCLTLTDCKIRNEQTDLLPKQCYPATVCVDTESRTGSGTSVEDCSTNCLPFRKRKVDKVESSELLKVSDKDFDLSQIDSNATELDNETVINDEDNDINDCLDAYQFTEIETMKQIVCSNTTDCCNEMDGDTCSDTHDCNDKTVGMFIGKQDNLGAINVVSDSVDMVDCLNEGMETCLINCNNIDQIKAPSLDKNKELKKNVFSESERKLPTKSMSNSYCSPHELQKLTLYAEETDTEYVNDLHLNRIFCNMLVKLKSTCNPSRLSLLYISSRLSFLGIQAALIGYNDVTIATPEEHHSTINQVALLNGCEDIILTKTAGLDSDDTKYDVIICDVVESCGALLPKAFENMASYRFSHLKSCGKLLPGKVKILGMFIESEELETRSHVTGNDKTLGFHIAEFINVYQMKNHVDIDLMTLTFTRLTEVQEMLMLDFDALTTETTTDFLTRTVDKSLHVTSGGKASAFVYWFEFMLDESTVINTLNSRFHWKQAGIMISEDVTMETGQILLTQLKLENSFLDIKVKRTQSYNGRT